MASGVNMVSGPAADPRLGPYVLRRWLAQGGMAELYLAHFADPERPPEVVVVKKVLPQFAEDAQFTRMFAREARVAAALDHPNIVNVYDEAEDGASYFAMEYVHGFDLSRLLRELRERRAVMPLEHALTIAVGLSAGLHHAHELRGPDEKLVGVVHRDVSASNVMLSFNGQVKIADFGVAKALALTSFTQAGTRKGKLSYMSPEQARADPIDRRADVFSIGVVLFEMTTMRRLFNGDNELAIMFQILHRERTKPSDVWPGYPPELEAIVMKAVAAERDDRFATALELQHALEQFARHARLRLSYEALGTFLRQLVPPPPHPSEDPGFFSDDASYTGQDVATAVEAEKSATIPGSGPSEPDSMAPLPAAPNSVPEQVTVAEGGLPQTVVAGLAAVRAPSVTAPYGPAASSPVAAPVRRSGEPIGLIAGVAGGVLVTLGVGAFLLLRTPDEPRPEPAQQGEPADESPKPLPEPAPVSVEPAVSPGASPAPDSPPTEPAAVEAPAPAPQEGTDSPAAAPAPEPIEAAPANPSKRKKRRKKGKTGSKPAPVEQPAPKDEPKKPKVSPTDTLLPIGDKNK